MTQAEVRDNTVQRLKDHEVGPCGNVDELPPPKQVKKALFLEEDVSLAAAMIEDAGSQTGIAQENIEVQVVAGVDEPNYEVNKPKIVEHEDHGGAVGQINGQQEKVTGRDVLDMETEGSEKAEQQIQIQEQCVHLLPQVVQNVRDAGEVELSSSAMGGLEISAAEDDVVSGSVELDGGEGSLELMETDSSVLCSREEEVKIKGKSGMQEQVGVKKKVKGSLVLKGIGSKKRFVQLMVTPRKRIVPKNEVSNGGGLNLKNQVVEKGMAGGSKPPKQVK